MPAETGQKRHREGELATHVAQPSRSKKVKTDWGTSGSTETVRKEEQLQNIIFLHEGLKYLQERQDKYPAIHYNYRRAESLQDAFLGYNKLSSAGGSGISFNPQPLKQTMLILLIR